MGFYLLIDVYLLFILGKLIFEQIYYNYDNLCKESSRDENRRFSQRLIKETQSNDNQGDSIKDYSRKQGNLIKDKSGKLLLSNLL